MNEPLITEDEELTRGLGYLTQQDPDFERVVARFGPPPLWARDPGFGGLLRTILGQQVSETSARRAFSRLREAASPLTPEKFLELDDAALKKVGFSRQKARYGRVLAEAVASGALDLGGAPCARGRRRPRRTHQAPRHRPLDRGRVPAHVAAPPRRVAGRGPSHRARGATPQRAGGKTDEGGVGGARRALATVAFGGGAARVAPLPAGASVTRAGKLA